LKKPLLVPRKKVIGIAADQEPPTEVELEVIGIIQHKILSKDRPQGPRLKAADQGEGDRLAN
ncbi:hypothetical protein BAE44_0010119, partial [Dichanthelium oligosanthes]